MEKIRSTTVLAVVHNGEVAIGADGQATMGATVAKNQVKKIRKMLDGKIVTGFAGSTADAFTLLERFEENARTVINEKLNGIKPICDRLTQTTSTGKYKYYIALELSGEELVNDYYSSLTKNESLKIDYNYEKFKKTFDEEMKKMENQ